MTKLEILKAYRCAILEMSVLERQMARHEAAVLPRGAGAVRFDGMPRGTNNPEAAEEQHVDGILQLLAEKRAELDEIVHQFEDILAEVHDPRLRLILRQYYGMGESDEAIAMLLDMSGRRISQLRSAFIRGLPQPTPARRSAKARRGQPMARVGGAVCGGRT